jgi:hypothetical protein
MVIDIPIWANDAADIASITSANNSERMEGMIRIALPLGRSSFACPVMLCICGLRGWTGAISGRDVPTTSSRQQIVLPGTFSLRITSSLVKNAHVNGSNHLSLVLSLLPLTANGKTCVSH